MKQIFVSSMMNITLFGSSSTLQPNSIFLSHRSSFQPPDSQQYFSLTPLQPPAPVPTQRTEWSNAWWWWTACSQAHQMFPVHPYLVPVAFSSAVQDFDFYLDSMQFGIRWILSIFPAWNSYREVVAGVLAVCHHMPAPTWEPYCISLLRNFKSSTWLGKLHDLPLKCQKVSQKRLGYEWLCRPKRIVFAHNLSTA